MRWRRWLTPLRIIISGALLAYLIWRADPARVWQSWQAVRLPLVALALAMQLAGVALSAAKWGMLLAMRGRRQPYGWLFGTYLVGQFASNFLPTSVGGDAVRAAQLGRRIGSYSAASASIFIERLTGFLALSLIANLALLLAASGATGVRISSDSAVYWLSVLFGLAALAAMLVSFSAPQLQRSALGRRLPARTQPLLARVAQDLADYTPRGWPLLRILAMSLLYQSLLVAMHIVCGLALGIQAPALLYALMVPVTDMVGMAPIFLNNLGARDLVFTLYLAQSGVPAADAIGLAFLVFSVRLLVSVLGGVVALTGGVPVRST